MGILDRFRHDKSEEWPEQREQSLVLDLSESSLNGVRLGVAAEELARFGRPSNRKPFRHQRFLYDGLGVVIELQNDRVHYFGCPIHRMDTDDVGPCEVSVIFPDRAEIPVIDGTEAELLLAHLPEPRETDVDDQETLYVFAVRENLLELEVAPNGRVRRLNLFSDTE